METDDIVTELMYGDDIVKVKSEQDMLDLMEVMRLQGLFGDPIECPMCKESHKLKTEDDLHSFECEENCIFYEVSFKSKLKAVRTMNIFSTFVNTFNSPRKVYLKADSSEKREALPKEMNLAGLFNPGIEPEKPIQSTKQSSEQTEETEPTPNPKTKDELIDIIGRYTSIKTPYKDICKHLNDNGVKTITQKEWCVGNLSFFIHQYCRKTTNQRDIIPASKKKTKLQLIELIEGYLSEEMPYKEITDKLNTDNITTVRGNIWNDSTLQWFINDHIKKKPYYKPKKTVESKKPLKPAKTKRFDKDEIISILKRFEESGQTRETAIKFLNVKGLCTRRKLDWTSKNIYPFIVKNAPELLIKNIAIREKNKDHKEAHELKIIKKIKSYVKTGWEHEEIAEYLNSKAVIPFNGHNRWETETISNIVAEGTTINKPAEKKPENEPLEQIETKPEVKTPEDKEDIKNQMAELNKTESSPGTNKEKENAKRRKKLVKLIKKLRKESYTQNKIAIHLNDKEIKPFSNAKGWTGKSVDGFVRRHIKSITN